MELKDQITYYRKLAGLSVEQLSKLSGIPLSTLKKISAGITKDPQVETMRAIAHALGRSLDDFADDLPDMLVEANGGDVYAAVHALRRQAKGSDDVYLYAKHYGDKSFPMPVVHKPDQLSLFEEKLRVSGLPSEALLITQQRVPMLGTIHAGEPTYAEEEFESYVEAGATVHCDFALRVVGDSMVNARILDGDIVFIRRQDTVADGEIAAVLIDDETTLKRVRFLPGGMLMLQPENPKYQPIIVGGENETRTIRILGKAVAFQSDVR